MFHDLREAFRQAVANFRDELTGPALPHGMEPRSALAAAYAEAEARLVALAAEVTAVHAEAEGEARAGDTCRRQARMARDIGDLETADLATRFADRHDRRVAILREKTRVLAHELSDRHEELTEVAREAGFDPPVRPSVPEGVDPPGPEPSRAAPPPPGVADLDGPR